MKQTYFSDGEQFFAVAGSSVFRYYESEGWQRLPETTLEMLAKFAPGLGEVPKSKAPAPIPPEMLPAKKSFREVLQGKPR